MEKFLTDQAQEIFEFISDFKEIKNFTFVGGSALAYYLNHRLSEDLDFFTWEKEISLNFIEELKRYFSNKYEIKILNQTITKIDLNINNTKITFFANNWEKLKERDLLINNLYIAKKEILTAMKVNALSMRAKFRDYYDLFVISKELYNIQDIYDICLKNLPGINKKIFSTQLCFTNDIDDDNINNLSPKYNINKKEIRVYFERLINVFI